MVQLHTLSLALQVISLKVKRRIIKVKFLDTAEYTERTRCFFATTTLAKKN